MPIITSAHSRALLLALCMIFSPAVVYAHGEDYWNDFIIDNKNDLIVTTIGQVTKVLGDIARGRRQVTAWPDSDVRNVRINLVVLQEEVEEMLNHLAEEDGIHLQLESSLRAYPQAGRSVAGADAIEIALELLDYISSLEGADAFRAELEEDGVSVYMIDLMDAYIRTMGAYKSLQDSKKQLDEANAAFASRTAGSDLRYHLRNWLLSKGWDGLAARLAEEPAAEAGASGTEPTDNTTAPAGR